MNETCTVVGCENEAVVKLLEDKYGGANRCPACLEYEGDEEGWW